MLPIELETRISDLVGKWLWECTSVKAVVHAVIRSKERHPKIKKEVGLLMMNYTQSDKGNRVGNRLFME